MQGIEEQDGVTISLSPAAVGELNEDPEVVEMRENRQKPDRLEG